MLNHQSGLFRETIRPLRDAAACRLKFLHL